MSDEFASIAHIVGLVASKGELLAEFVPCFVTGERTRSDLIGSTQIIASPS